MDVQIFSPANRDDNRSEAAILGPSKIVRNTKRREACLSTFHGGKFGFILRLRRDRITPRTLGRRLPAPGTEGPFVCRVVIFV